ncbi:MAG: hypothetical protein ACLTTJ_14155 [Blautia sp.]
MVAQKAMEKMMIQDLAKIQCYIVNSSGGTAAKGYFLARALCAAQKIYCLDEPVARSGPTCDRRNVSVDQET